MKPVDYNEISKIYDDVRESDIQLINQFLEELPLHDALNILDIGCGTGNYTDQFQKVTQGRNYSFYGIDPSEAMLNKARQKNEFITYQVGAAENIPYPAGLFDFVYMTDVIHHVSDIHRMFSEIQRGLAPGGKVCIVTQSHEQIGQRPIAQFFPGTVSIDRDRYPAISVIIQAAEENRLSFLKVRTLFEGEELELGSDFLELVRKKGYSMLHLLPEKEYRIGLRALEDALRNGAIHCKYAGDSLIWLGKDRLSD